MSDRKPYEAPAVSDRPLTSAQKLELIAAILAEDVDGTGCNWYNKRVTLQAVNAVLMAPTALEAEAAL